MPQSPITGLSLIVSVLIIATAKIFNTLKKGGKNKLRTSKRTRIEIDRTKNVPLVVKIFAYVIPVSVFVLIVSFSIQSLLVLYKDTDKITVFDIARNLYHLNENKNINVSNNVVELDNNNNLPVVVVDELANASSSEDVNFADTYLEIDEAFSSIVKNIKINTLDVGTTSLLFAKGKKQKYLVPFMQLNNLPTDINDREVIATFFGIKEYRGTEKQNNILRKKLGDITVGELNGEAFYY